MRNHEACIKANAYVAVAQTRGALAEMKLGQFSFPFFKIRMIMKLTKGRFGGAKNFVGKLPKFGVYRLENWEMLGSSAIALSLHDDYKAAVEAAAWEEERGRKRALECAVVEFDYSPAKEEPGPPLIDPQDRGRRQRDE